jgi:cation transporter-like permease
LKSFHPARTATQLRQDLAKDWRRWTAVERILAAGLLAALLVAPVVSLATLIYATA